MLHLFLHEYPCNSALFIEYTILSFPSYTDTLALNHMAGCMWVYLRTLCSVPLVYLSILLPIYHMGARASDGITV